MENKAPAAAIRLTGGGCSQRQIARYAAPGLRTASANLPLVLRWPAMRDFVPRRRRALGGREHHGEVHLLTLAELPAPAHYGWLDDRDGQRQPIAHEDASRPVGLPKVIH